MHIILHEINQIKDAGNPVNREKINKHEEYLVLISGAKPV